MVTLGLCSDASCLKSENWPWIASRYITSWLPCVLVYSNCAVCHDIWRWSDFFCAPDGRMVLCNHSTPISSSCCSPRVIKPRSANLKTSAALVSASKEYSTHLSGMTVNPPASSSRHRLHGMAVYSTTRTHPQRFSQRHKHQGPSAKQEVDQQPLDSLGKADACKR